MVSRVTFVLFNNPATFLPPKTLLPFLNAFGVKFVILIGMVCLKGRVRPQDELGTCNNSTGMDPLDHSRLIISFRFVSRANPGVYQVNNIKQHHHEEKTSLKQCDECIDEFLASPNL